MRFTSFTASYSFIPACQVKAKIYQESRRHPFVSVFWLNGHKFSTHGFNKAFCLPHHFTRIIQFNRIAGVVRDQADFS